MDDHQHHQDIDAPRKDDRGQDATAQSEYLRVLLKRNRVIRVATLSPSGWPTIVPIWFGLTPDGEIVATMPDSATVRNILRTGRATILVDEGVGYADLRGAMVLVDAQAVPAEEASPALQSAIEAQDSQYADEIVEMTTVRAALQELRHSPPRRTYRLRLVPRRGTWFALGGSVSGSLMCGPTKHA